jgi:hypothetical protein
MDKLEEWLNAGAEGTLFVNSLNEKKIAEWETITINCALNFSKKDLLKQFNGICESQNILKLLLVKNKMIVVVTDAHLLLENDHEFFTSKSFGRIFVSDSLKEDSSSENVLEILKSTKKEDYEFLKKIQTKSIICSAYLLKNCFHADVMKILCESNMLESNLCGIELNDFHPIVGVVHPLQNFTENDINSFINPTAWSHNQNKNYKSKLLHNIRKLCGNDYQDWEECIHLRNCIIYLIGQGDYQKAYHLCPSISIIKSMPKMLMDNSKISTKNVKLLSEYENSFKSKKK